MKYPVILIHIEEESEFPPSSMLPYVKRRLQSVLDKWSSVDRLLIEREQKLEMSTGSFQAFYTHAEGLLNWLRRKLEMGALSGHPPADLEIVEGYQKEIKVRERAGQGGEEEEEERGGRKRRKKERGGRRKREGGGGEGRRRISPLNFYSLCYCLAYIDD